MATREPVALMRERSSVLSDRRNTEGGLTSAQRETLSRVERDAGNISFEVVTAVGNNGEILFQAMGNEDSVVVPDSEYPKMKDAVITHNHPGRFNYGLYGNTLATEVGSSLSAADILTAIDANAKEIRAATKGGYIFSLKRPAGGWGIDTKRSGWDSTLAEEFRRTEYKYDKQYLYKNPGLKTFSMAEDSANRYETADWARRVVLKRHSTVRELADKYGWKYTRRRWKQ